MHAYQSLEALGVQVRAPAKDLNLSQILVLLLLFEKSSEPARREGPQN